MKSINEKAYSLIGIDGNAYSIMGYVGNAMAECGRTKEEIRAYQNDAMSSDYDNLLCVSMDMLEILNNENGYRPGHQMTKPNGFAWEDQEPEEIEESYNYSFNNQNIQDSQDKIIYLDKLVKIPENDECLYMTDDDMTSIDSSLEEMINHLTKFSFVINVINDTDLLVVISRDNLYNFYNKFAKDINDVVSFQELKPFIYTAQDFNMMSE